jgi:hypothetical protein
MFGAAVVSDAFRDLMFGHMCVLRVAPEQVSQMQHSIRTLINVVCIVHCSLPIFTGICLCCYLDRTNLAFASISLNKDLLFSAEVGTVPFVTCPYM